MGVLDELKNEANKLRDQQQLNAEQQQQAVQEARESLYPYLEKIYIYLRDLVDQLNYVKPDVPRSYEIKNVGQMVGLEQGFYEIQPANREDLSEISLRFSARKQESYRFDLRVLGNVEKQIDAIKSYGLQVENAQLLSDSDTGQLLRVVLKGYVPISFEFTANYDSQTIQLRIKNLEHLGVVSYVLKPEQIDSVFLDEFAKYLLNRENTFLKEDLPKEIRRRLNKRLALDEEKKQKQLLGKARRVASSIKTLFNKKQNLILSYLDQDIELKPSNPSFVIGREPDCDLVVKANRASRRHARIEFRNGGYIFTDLSLNGSLIKTDVGDEVYLHLEEFTLSGSGVIFLGKIESSEDSYKVHFDCDYE